MLFSRIFKHGEWVVVISVLALVIIAILAGMDLDVNAQESSDAGSVEVAAETTDQPSPIKVAGWFSHESAQPEMQLAMLSPSSMKPLGESLVAYSPTVIDPFLYTLLGFDVTERNPDGSFNILPALIDIDRETVELIKRKLVHYNNDEGEFESLLLRETAASMAEREGLIAEEESFCLLDILQWPISTVREVPVTFSGLEDIRDITIIPELEEGAFLRNKMVYRKDNEGEGEGEGEGECENFSGFDLAYDFVVFASAMIPGFESGQETEIDFNGFEVSENGSIGQIANGIPDLAEILLLQKLLKEDNYDAVERWCDLKELYGAPVSGYEPIYNIGIAYCCIGDLGSVWLGAILLSYAVNEPEGEGEGEWVPEMDLEKVFTVMATTDFQFSASGDIDGDDYSALIEWTQSEDTTFGDWYDDYEYNVLNTSSYNITVRTITRSASHYNLTTGSYSDLTGDILQIYPSIEYVADGSEVVMYPLFGFNLNDFNNIEPKFDHWYITGETALSPHYSTREPLELTVESDINIDLSLIVLDPAAVLWDPEGEGEDVRLFVLYIYAKCVDVM